MPTDLATRDLFDRWERVWHEGRYDLIPACVAPSYIRHDESGTRTVTPAEYAAELQAAHRARPNMRIVVYDHELTADRAWYRFSIVWSDATTGERRSRAGLQSCRVEGGKLAETWIALLPLGSTWPDATGLKHWTSLPPGR